MDLAEFTERPDWRVMRVLAVNAGSSTLKLSLLADDDTVLADRLVEIPSGSDAASKALLDALDELPAPPDAVGHRVVHGGDEFTSPVRLSREVRDRIASFTDLAPLHQPAALTGIDLVDRALPSVPGVACFDTAFHSAMPSEAYTYALPSEWQGLRRYGFHGLSHAYASHRAPELLGSSQASARLVICHLGAGVSLSAVRDGRCVDTTMGFTPLEGLVMATRSGSVDPGLLLYLQRNRGVDADELDQALNHRSGLQGLAGTADMREVIRQASAGDSAARLALDVYLHRLRAGVAGMVASLGGLDALVFTAGVGEHSPEVRSRTVRGLEFLGLRIDPALNADAEPDSDLSPPNAPARCLVIAAREDLQIAGEVRNLLAS